MEGTRYAIPMTQQRVALDAGREQIVATAIGVDRSARRLRGAVQRDLGFRAGGSAKPGLALSTGARRRAGGSPRASGWLFAYERAPRLRVARVVDVDPAIEDVLTLPRGGSRRLRGAPGRPTVVYVKLAPGASAERLGAPRRAASCPPARR